MSGTLCWAAHRVYYLGQLGEWCMLIPSGCMTKNERSGPIGALLPEPKSFRGTLESFQCTHLLAGIDANCNATNLNGVLMVMPDFQVSGFLR